MFLRYFRSSHFLQQYTLWLFIGILLRVPVFLGSGTPPPADGTLVFQTFFALLTKMPLLSALLALLFSLINAFVLNICVHAEDMINRTTALPALLFVIFTGLMPGMHYLHPAHIALLLIILAVYHIFTSYKIEEPYTNLFNAGLFLSLSGLVHTPSMFLLIILFISLLVFRAVKWRDWFIPLLGMLVPWMYFYVWQLWTNTAFDQFFKPEIFPNPMIPATPMLSIKNLVFLAGFVPLTLYSLVMIISRTNEMVISTRRMFWVLIWLVPAIFGLLSLDTNYAEVGYLITAPLSAITAYILFTMRRYKYLDVFFTLWVILVFTVKFTPYFRYVI